ncbi:ABC transporter ATP-binding protein [Moritella sp. 28]|uniref:ABC transporter ATP-binding protein n=1 Tax=Moritella sp. 28 TaxID=2746232 RepID=UPI001BA6A019|nr:ABC transporter ATP-binding protein [Moritella sp. 28]QUM85583.1 ABC transporter ATP-binding protein [Moritella sp. 28]
MLVVNDIETLYGQSQVLFGISITINAGEVVSLMGRNGAGKTTTVRSIMGLTPVAAGTIHFKDQRSETLQPYKIARLGLGLVPEGRMITPNLSVKENLIATAFIPKGRDNPWTLSRVYSLFPRLEERERSMGNQLSGGEQQMLAIGRALLTNPDLLILDEATEGLAPLIRQEIMDCLVLLKTEGLAILIVDKHLHALNQLVDRHYIIDKGKVAWSGTPQALMQAPDVQHRLLGV